MSSPKSGYLRPINFKQGVVDMNHGAGGRVGAQLVNELFAKAILRKTAPVTGNTSNG